MCKQTILLGAIFLVALLGIFPVEGKSLIDPSRVRINFFYLESVKKIFF